MERDPKMRRRCVVWHRCGAESSAALFNALSSRGLRVETSGSGHEVLAMGCVEQRRGRGLIVVLDGGGGGGEELGDQSRVLEGMEQFCPLGLVWVYEEGANPPLRGFVEKGVEVEDEKPVVAESKTSADGGPALRLSGVNGGLGGVKSGASLRASDVLDRDELAALLKPNE